MKNICGHFIEMVTYIENLAIHIHDIGETNVNVLREITSFIRKAACKIGSIEVFVKEMFYDKHYDLGNFQILRDDFLCHLNK